MRITICGGGNAAHTSAGLFSTNPEHQVNVYISFPEEAGKWQRGISENEGITVSTTNQETKGKPNKVSSSAEEVVPGSQLVLLALPAFAHESILEEIKPWLDEDALVGVLAARGCFDLSAREILDEKANTIPLFGLQTLPWACRIVEFGKAVNILGTKAKVGFAVCPPQKTDQVCSFVTEQLHIKLEPIGSFLCLTLAGTGQIIHPGVMYGLFRNWEGSPFPEAPLFYQGIDDDTALILQRMSDEIQSIKAAILNQFPELDLEAVRPLGDWISQSYAGQIEDTSSLRNYFVTNRSYKGLTVPMQKTEQGLKPDFRARYLTEDVPYALVATRGIAELAGIATPMIDQVINWSQEKIGKEYLLDSKLQGSDINETRAPQRFGFETLETMIEAMFCP